GPGTHWQTWGRGAGGRTVNPWRADRTPGGSSAGAAVAVAAGMADVATARASTTEVRAPVRPGPPGALRKRAALRGLRWNAFDFPRMA
ncbi:hypothetical protein G3I27_03870, partial [Streptomyces sp. SID10692]|uniref:amidase family protein n=1 Tax=Streptomyces sp. SID10692 TaxID=2706026 RepID=UPI00141163DE|nr:hypothetical protein [Streptomyces sp. SID10692]